MRFAVTLMSLAVFLAMAGSTSSRAQSQKSAPADQDTPQQATDDAQQTPAPLAVGSMAIASSAGLAVEAMSIDIDVEKVTYTYKLKNNGSSKLSLFASVTEPDLEVNSDGSTVYDLPSDKAENVVGLEVMANRQPVATNSDVQAVALGVNRRAELLAAKVPLIPFGQATDDALAGAKPDTIAELEGLGLVTPRDPSQPGAAVTADWSLHVVHGWKQELGPNASTDVTIGFTPIKAVYTIDSSSLDQFDALKDETCLTPQIKNAVKALLAAKGSTADVADMLIANDGPARWLDNPPARVTVHKPTPDSIVAFCGLDPKAKAASFVTGTMAPSNEAAALRVLIFARSNGQ